MKAKIINSKKIKLDKKSIYLRKLILLCLKSEKRGHVGSAMSLVEIIRVLYEKFIIKGKSKFILSKGHGCLALYSVLYDNGFISKKDLTSIGKFDSKLGGHPEHDKVNGVEISTGALGHGLPIAIGMAIANKIKKKNKHLFVVCGDGEINEGSIWEALLSASKHQLDNLTLFVDYNKLQSYGRTKDILDLEPITEKFKSFKFNTFNVNGHDINEIENTIKKSLKLKKKPSVIICHTVKGKGINVAEGNPSWHHKSFLNDEDISKIEKSLR